METGIKRIIERINRVDVYSIVEKKVYNRKINNPV